MSKDAENSIYKQFLSYLTPSPEKYIPAVFKFFVDNKTQIEKDWFDEDKKRLMKLALEDNLEKIETSKFKVRFTNKGEGGREYKISSIAAYYGDLLRLGQILFPEKLQKFKEQIINFIPVAYSEDQRTILEIIGEVADEDLTVVNGIYSKESNDDRRYLLPDSYIYVVSEYQKRGCDLKTPLAILKSFVDDELIMESDKRYALNAMELFLTGEDDKFKQYLQNIFGQYKKSTTPKIAEIANSLLISKYKNECAINWRFKEIKNRFQAFERPEGFHSVSPIEEEIDSLFLAKPLIDLNDEKYFDKFLDLLQFSFRKANIYKDRKYQGYIAYMQRIVLSYVENLKGKKTFTPLRKLEKYIDEKGGNEGINWLKRRIVDIKKIYIQELTPKEINGTIDFVNQLDKT